MITAVKITGDSENRYNHTDLQNFNHIRKNGNLIPLSNGKIISFDDNIVNVEFVNPAVTTRIASVNSAEIPYIENKGYYVNDFLNCIDVVGDFTLMYSNISSKLTRIDTRTNLETEIKFEKNGDAVIKLVANSLNKFMIVSSVVDGFVAQSYEIIDNVAVPTSDIISGVVLDKNDPSYVLSINNQKIEIFIFKDKLMKYNFDIPILESDFGFKVGSDDVCKYAELSDDKKSILIYATKKNQSQFGNANDITGVIYIYKFKSDTISYDEKKIEIPRALEQHMIIKDVCDNFEGLTYLTTDKNQKTCMYYADFESFERRRITSLVSTDMSLIDCIISTNDTYSLDKKLIQNTGDGFIVRKNDKILTYNACSNLIKVGENIYFMEHTGETDSLIITSKGVEKRIALKDINRLFSTEISPIMYSLTPENDDSISIIAFYPYKDSWDIMSGTYRFYSTEELLSLLDSIYR